MFTVKKKIKIKHILFSKNHNQIAYTLHCKPCVLHLLATKNSFEINIQTNTARYCVPDMENVDEEF